MILPRIGHWNCGVGPGGGAVAAGGGPSWVGPPLAAAAGGAAAAVFCSVAPDGGGSASRFTGPGGPLGDPLAGGAPVVEAVSVGGTYFAPGTSRVWPGRSE